jgi:hypothetical protein
MPNTALPQIGTFRVAVKPSPTEPVMVASWRE